MQNEKKIIEALITLDYRQHTKNKKMYYKFVEDRKYGVTIAGKVPEPFVFINDVQVFDQADEEIQKVVSAMSKLDEKVEKTAAENKPVDTRGELKMTRCELCDLEIALKDAFPVGYPDTHAVCKMCSEEIASGNVNVEAWYQQQEPAKTKKKTGVPPKETATVEPVKTAEPVETDEPTCVKNSIVGFPLQLGELGKIKIGKKGEEKKSRAGTKFKMPMKLDHFIVTTTEKNKKTDQFIEDSGIMEILGEDCTKIPVTVPYNDIDLIIPNSYTHYEKSKCVCRGDGEHAQLESGEIVQCNPKMCPYFEKKKCKQNAVLSVMLDDASMVGGVHKLRTTSFNSLRNIKSSLTFIKARTHGILAGLPLLLTLQPKTVNIPDGTGTTVIYMVNLVYNGKTRDLNDIAMEISRQESGIEMAQLESAAAEQLLIPVSAEEQKDIQNEFFPEER